MDDRMRFQRLMSGGDVDRLPVLALEPFEEGAISRWNTEGLPRGVDVVEYLGMSRLVSIPLSFSPLPAFPREIVSEDEDYVVERGDMGALIRRRRDNPTIFYGHVDHPVKTKADWYEYRKRFLPSRDRLPTEWYEEIVPRLRDSRDPVALTLFPFFFRLGFYVLGMERFLSAFYEEPDLVEEMFAYWSDFTVAIIGPVLDAVRPDVVLFTEDLACKNGPMISPELYGRFWHPHQDAVIRLIRDRGVAVLCQWSSGDLRPLLPTMIDHGINCTWPLEVMAGMDAVELERKFGDSLRLGGNVAKEAVIAGPDAIDAELARLQPVIRKGGLLPAMDDMASPDMPFAHYRYLIERLQSLRLG